MTQQVLIVDDHPLVAEALTLAVRQSGAVASVHVSPDLKGARARMEAGARYDLILLDLMLPDSEGLSGLLAIKAALPDVRVAIVTSRANAETVRSAAELGAVGYVLKTTPFGELAEHCRALLAGDTRFPQLEPDAAGLADDAAGPGLASLSAAQRRIFLSLNGGASNKQIAYDLDLAEATVKAHMTAIFRKMGVTNRSQAIVLARRLSGDV